MSEQENKDIVWRFIDEAYNKGNLSVGDEWLAANSVFHTPDADIEGIEGWKKYASAFLTGFSDLVVSVEDTIAEGDKVMAHWTCRGTHTGELLGIAPTGKQVTWTGIAIYRFSGGKIVEIQGWNDSLGLMRQLGAIPSG
jgi:predicted ester cyclase